MHRSLQGFTAGLIGAAILIAIMYAMQAAGLGGPPGFVGTYRAFFPENPPVDHVVAASLFALSGGVWGLLFGVLVTRPTPLRGALFGLLPTLWVWLVVAPATGQPFFNGFTPRGLLLPLLFNVVIWGTFVGWYVLRRTPRRRSAL